MNRVGWSDVVTRTRLFVTLWFSAVALMAGAIVLWSRQSPDALLQVDSFWDAAMQVAFLAFPTLILYVVLARPATTVLVEGVLIVVAISASWWTTATDPHSTASLSPFGIGWLLGPIAIVLVWSIPILVKGSRRRRPDDAKAPRT